MGLSLALVDRPSEALAALDRAVAQNPRYGSGGESIAACCSTGSDEPRRPRPRSRWPRSSANRGCDLGTRRWSGNRLANAHALLAQEYRSAGALDGAIAQYRRALELRPTYVDIRVALARVLLDAQRFAVAADELDEVLAAQPGQLEALLLRGLAAYFSGAFNTARAMWDRAGAADPDHRRVTVYRSMLARRQGESGPDGASR